MRKYLGLILAIATSAPCATRLKDLVSVEGVRENQLIGYGLVVGLRGTGDRQQTVFSVQSLTNLLQQMGVSVPSTAIRVNNVAAVMVTSALPAFGQPGARIDVTAAAIGDASSLQGGLLLLTSLKGIDGQVYAIAQGPLLTGGFSAGGGGSSQTVGHPTVGRVPGGATVERAAPSVAPSKIVRLQLHHQDFTTATRIVENVNKKFGGTAAVAESSGLVSVTPPEQYRAKPVEFIAELEKLEVQSDHAARVVVNERTGTIVMGKDVKVAPVAIMHGNLSVEIQTTMTVSQPGAFSKGQTAVVPQVGVDVKEEQARNIVLSNGATVEELVRALMSIGSTPRDVISILQNLRSAGALDAELDVV
jgi:flagellar P-ring protein FlgI